MPELEQSESNTTQRRARITRGVCSKDNKRKETKPFFLHACIQRHRRAPYTSNGKTSWGPLIETNDSTPKCLFLVINNEIEEPSMTLKDFFTLEHNALLLGIAKHEIEWLVVQRNNRAFSINDECISGETLLCHALKDMHVKINLFI